MGRRLLVVGLALILALAPRAAWAHAVLFFSDPSPDAVLGAPPASVSLTFSEPVAPAGKGIKVFSPTGHQVAGPVRVVGHALTAPINSTETGTYVVTWQALAADTHPSRGAFSFVVGQPSANPYLPALSGGEIGTATPLGFALQALARWIHFIGVALAFGTIAYQVVTRREPRLRRLVVAGVLLLIAAEPVALIAQLASLSFDGDTAIAVLASGFGRLLGLRLAIALSVWALLALESPWPILALGAGMALVDGASAHAIAGLPGAGLVLDAIHVAAMGIWVGGLTAFAFAPDRRFSRYAIDALAVAIGSGLLLALAHLSSAAALITTGYGWVILVKAGIVAAALVTAVLGRQRIEAWVASIVLALAAVLISLPPPR
ncbi:MAG TPA: copper resistance protein CopC [Candidatus Dormibacteraeota bacterium]|nr:copper resistance protein CopC [Candidatus Dormibacteraeota bacterium]